MLLLAICTLSLASAASAAAQHTPAFYRKQRILRAMSSGERITMRLRGGGELEHSAAATSTAVTKPYRDGSTAPTITMRLRGGGELEHSAAATRTAVTKPYRDGSTAPTIPMRLRGGGGGGGEGGAVPSTAALLNRKERILRAVSSGQAVTEDALLAIEAAAITADRPSPTTWDDPRHNGASPALLRQAASSGLSFAAAASASARSSSSARVCHRKRRMLQAVSSGHSVTHALERGYVSSC